MTKLTAIYLQVWELIGKEGWGRHTKPDPEPGETIASDAEEVFRRWNWEERQKRAEELADAAVKYGEQT